MPDFASKQIYYGCLFCSIRQEAEVLQRLDRYEGLSVLSPVRQHYYRKKGSFEIVEDVVFPGYLFFATQSPDFPIQRLEETTGAFKVLRYDSREWVLQGDDALLAERLFKSGGVIGLSRGRFEDGRLHILDGFLKPYEKDICKVDRRHRAAMIRTKMDGRVVELWLGYCLDEDA